jgi:hypothetical protein
MRGPIFCQDDADQPMTSFATSSWLVALAVCVGGCFPSFDGLSGGASGAGGEGGLGEAGGPGDAAIDGSTEAGANDASGTNDAPTCTTVDMNATMSKNCGRCGRDCEYGQCVDGDCMPYVLVSDQQPVQLALDHAFLYWTNAGNNGSVYRISRTPGAGATLLVSGQANPSGIVATLDKIYWLDQGTADQSGRITGSDGFVMSSALDGTGVRLVGSSFKRPSSLVIDSGRVYVAEHGVNQINGASDGDVMSCAIPDCADRHFHDAAIFPMQVLLRAGLLYWTSEPGSNDDSGSIWQFPLSNGTKATPLFPGTKPQAYRMTFSGDGSTIYYTSKNLQTITRHPLGPGMVTSLHMNFEPRAVVVDDNELFAIVAGDYTVMPSNMGTLVRVGHEDLTSDGNPPASLKKYVVPRGGDAIIDGGRSVYFTTEKSIMKLVK